MNTIDFNLEQILSFAEAAKYVASRFRGQRNGLHLSTVHRWASRGIKGVRLESIVVGGTRCTSAEALQRFFTRLAGDDGAAASTGSPTSPSDPTSPATSPALTAARQRRVAEAKDELARQGV
jgi:hypothetical protein